MTDAAPPAELSELAHAITAIAYDLHLLLIRAGIETAPEAAERLTTHGLEIAEALGDTTAARLLLGLALALRKPDTTLASLAAAPPEGAAE